MFVTLVILYLAGMIPVFCYFFVFLFGFPTSSLVQFYIKNALICLFDMNKVAV